MSRVEVVVEIGPNHNGDLELAKRLIRTAKECGADAVKFQLYTLDEILALRGTGLSPQPWAERWPTLPELYAAALTPLEWLPTLAQTARDVGLPWFASVFGAESLAACEAEGCPRYKIAAGDAADAHLLHIVRLTRKDTVRSSRRPGDVLHLDIFGGLTDAEGDIPMQGCDMLEVYCPPGYPQRMWDLAVLRDYDEGCHFYNGFSFHGLDVAVPSHAVAAGATYIEAHLQDDETPAVIDGFFSLPPAGFRLMVEQVRWAQETLHG